jgi:hypothetical protein
MTKLPFAVLSLVVLAASASAQTFESRVADASGAAAGQFAVQGSPTIYAKTIVCANAPAAAQLPGTLKFYTHLDGKLMSKLPVDDTASQLNDYRSAGIREGKWHFDAWSCDTQDYYFSFSMGDLVRASRSETSRAVKGHARVETRGQVDFEGDIDCVANF